MRWGIKKGLGASNLITILNQEKYFRLWLQEKEKSARVKSKMHYIQN